MKRIYYLLPIVIVLGAGALVLSLQRPDPGVNELATAAEPIAPAPVRSAAPAVNANPAPSAAASKTTAQWIADTSSGDASTRATAITALAEAPRAEALPVLSRILTDGEPLVDRPLALTSLREIALNQGDSDGAIRDAVRHVIYHGDDFTKTDDAQETLDIIEESLMRQ